MKDFKGIYFIGNKRKKYNEKFHEKHNLFVVLENSTVWKARKDTFTWFWSLNNAASMLRLMEFVRSHNEVRMSQMLESKRNWYGWGHLHILPFLRCQMIHKMIAYLLQSKAGLGFKKNSQNSKLIQRSLKFLHSILFYSINSLSYDK